jgi:hypothetical protein
VFDNTVGGAGAKLAWHAGAGDGQGYFSRRRIVERSDGKVCRISGMGTANNVF